MGKNSRRPADPEQHGTELELAVSNVAHGGVFVARHEGRVVFVPDTLPGERVLARVSDATHGSFWRAEALRVLEPSAHRRPHVWQAASIEREPRDRVGGAEFGHIDLPHQRELKAAVVADALTRMAGLERDVVVEGVSGDDETAGTGWRTRVRLHVADDGTVGPYAARSHRVIAVDELPLATEAVAAAAPLTANHAGADSIDIVAPSVGGVRVVVNRPGNRRRAAADRERIVERVGDREFALDAAGFWQVHRAAAETLSSAVQSAVDESLFDPRAANLDLYGGVGLFAAALGDRFGRTTRITSVESSEAATDHAAANLAEWVGASALTDRVDRYLNRIAADATGPERGRLAAATVVLDPPRSGAGRAVIERLVELHPAQLVYVACDPVAFARDLGMLRAGGYELDQLRAFDLFPNTHHVELVARLTPLP
jgi:tRNA/tmRNA/rRNA uracil-C5-methylase (TrmA/RlmC/RlmD family)